MTPTAFTVPGHVRYPRDREVQIITVHATRGTAPPNAQFLATVNWFRAAPDYGQWGPTADACAGAQGEQAVFTRAGGSHARDFCTYDAGYGSLGPPHELAASEVAFSIEFAQSASLEPYTEACIAAGAEIARGVVQQYGVPLVRIPYWDQRATAPVPRGFVGHEDTANGRRFGKSDPGPLFPWGRFFTLIAAPDGAPTYTVQRGDTLSGIAVRHGLTVARLVESNHLRDANHIEIGQVLRVAAGTPPAVDVAIVSALVREMRAYAFAAQQAAQQAQVAAAHAVKQADEAERLLGV